MSIATKTRISTFVVVVGGFFLFSIAASAQTCGPPPPPPTCVLTLETDHMPATSVCPSRVNATVTYSAILNAQPACGDNAPAPGCCAFSCTMHTLDRSFQQIACHVGVVLGFNQAKPPILVAGSEASSETVNFTATDHIFHTLNILTTVIDSNGLITTYTSANIGTQCS
jgi:hypothetical protein